MERYNIGGISRIKFYRKIKWGVNSEGVSGV